MHLGCIHRIISSTEKDMSHLFRYKKGELRTRTDKTPHFLETSFVHEGEGVPESKIADSIEGSGHATMAENKFKIRLALGVERRPTDLFVDEPPGGNGVNPTKLITRDTQRHGGCGEGADVSNRNTIRSLSWLKGQAEAITSWKVSEKTRRLPSSSRGERRRYRKVPTVTGEFRSADKPTAFSRPSSHYAALTWSLYYLGSAYRVTATSYQALAAHRSHLSQLSPYSPTRAQHLTHRIMHRRRVPIYSGIFLCFTCFLCGTASDHFCEGKKRQSILRGFDPVDFVDTPSALLILAFLLSNCLLYHTNWLNQPNTRKVGRYSLFFRFHFFCWAMVVFTALPEVGLATLRKSSCYCQMMLNRLYNLSG